MRNFVLLLIITVFSGNMCLAQGPSFLKRSIYDVVVKPVDLSGKSAYYKPVFGEGDLNARAVNGISRYGYLSVDSGGSSNTVKFSREEQIIFITEGTGILNYEKEVIPVTENDFIYIPEGVKFSLANPRENVLKAIIMGFVLPEDVKIKETPHLMIANSDKVERQVLGQHGPTTLFRLMMGTTASKRDRLAAAYQVNSLFIMDFAPGGTNIPHRHSTEEEIYFILRGSGEMVAGETPDGKEARYPAKEGDAFYFAPNTLIGFYSGTQEGEEHAMILAVRSRYIKSAEPVK